MQICCPNCTKLIPPYDEETLRKHEVAIYKDGFHYINPAFLADIELRRNCTNYFELQEKYNIRYTRYSEDAVEDFPVEIEKFMPLINGDYLIYYEATSISTMEPLIDEESRK
jgi:hypothetical protein